MSTVSCCSSCSSSSSSIVGTALVCLVLDMEIMGCDIGVALGVQCKVEEAVLRISTILGD